MVAKISVGNSLYGALAYNGEKINEAKGRLLTTNRIYNDGTGTMDIHRAMEDFLALMPVRSKVEKPVVHISLNPHPDDILTDTELQNIAREYLEKMGFGNQPYLVFKHEDIDRHHLHIVTVRVDENGRSIDTRNNFYRSKQITRELERKYGLHDAERKNRRLDTPLRKVDASAGDVKKQVGNIVKALNGQYRFQTMGEYRALLSLYNMTVEEAHGNVRRREYHGLVYSVTDDKGNKVGNPFKSSLFGKSVGYEAVQKKFARSKQEFKERKLADMTKRTVLSVLEGTYDKEKFVATLKGKGIDTVLRYTEEGRIYGATFIDHRTGCVLNGSRMGKELSANALQEHFTQPYAGQPSIPLSVMVEGQEDKQGYSGGEYENHSGGMNLFAPEGPAVDAEEEAFIRAMQRKKKKKKRGCFWRIVFWLALVVFIGSVGTLGYLFYTYWQGQNEYEEIASRAVEVPEDGNVANLADLVVDWDALRAINPDIVAWVYMPGTIINYPVAHKDGDSEYYLHHNFSLGEGSFGAEFGSIMLSGENAGDFSDEVNILYGHHMRNGSMFALFAEFRDSAIFNEHRTIYLLTPEGNYRLQTFAVEHVPMTHASIATPNYPTDEEFTAFKDWLVEESIVTPDPDTTDTLADATKLFGFCTCDGADNTWRYITFADVAEFVPISYVGADTYQGDTAVEDGAADEIAADAQERAEN